MSHDHSDQSRNEGLTRRDFVKKGIGIAGLALGGMAIGTVPMLSAMGSSEGGEFEIKHEEFDYTPTTVYYAKPAPEGVKFAMVIDVKACIGCRRCAFACMKENNIGRDSGFTWIKLLEMEPGNLDLDESDPYFKEGGRPDRWYLPLQCQHCDSPPCVQGCPVSATRKEADGLVIQDYSQCIGCRLCMINCPYYARHFNWKDPMVPDDERNPSPAVPIRPRGVVEKCTFCIHRTREGLETRCTEVCPVQARKFGNINDPNSAVSQMLQTRRLLFRVKEELGTFPSIWFVG